MSLLEIKNLHVSVDGHEILKGIDLTVNPGEVHSIMGPNGQARARWRRCWRGARPMRSPRRGSVQRQRPAGDEAGRGRLRRRVPGVPISGGNSGHQQRIFPALGAERDPQVSRPGRNGRDGFSAALPREAEAAGNGREADEPLGERRLLRRREKAQRDSADGGARAEARRFWTRPTPAWTSTRCESWPKA